jgi:hypothetical protein
VKRIGKAILMSLALIAFAAASAWAIEAAPSLTLLAGHGSAEDRFGDGDVLNLSAALDYPVSGALSLLAKFDHSETRWDDSFAIRCWPPIGDDSGSDVFSFGVKVWLR